MVMYGTGETGGETVGNSASNRRFFMVFAFFFVLTLQACAPLYYPAPPPQPAYTQNTYPNAYQTPYNQGGYQNPQGTVAYPPGQYQGNYPAGSYQPAVVVVKSCECPPQGLGFVRIHSAPPFASVYINGKAEGETPLEYLSIPAGKAHIELIHRQFGPADTVLDIRPGQKIDLKMHLTQYSDDEGEDE
jgi:PEGA domain